MSEPPKPDRQSEFVAGMLFALSEVANNTSDKRAVAVVIKDANIDRDEALASGIDPSDFNRVARICGWQLVDETDLQNAPYAVGVLVRARRTDIHPSQRVPRKLLALLADGRWSVQDVRGGRVTKVKVSTLDSDYDVIGDTEWGDVGPWLLRTKLEHSSRFVTITDDSAIGGSKRTFGFGIVREAHRFRTRADAEAAAATMDEAVEPVAESEVCW